MKDSMEYKINDFKLIVDGKEIEAEELINKFKLKKRSIKWKRIKARDKQ